MKADLDTGAPVVCRFLRTKAAFGAVVGEDPWQTGDSSTHVYWCLGTMEPVGPDEGLAHPHPCRSGRPCFQAPVD
jgi:hypothetical protein